MDFSEIKRSCSGQAFVQLLEIDMVTIIAGPLADFEKVSAIGLKMHIYHLGHHERTGGTLLFNEPLVNISFLLSLGKPQ